MAYCYPIQALPAVFPKFAQEFAADLDRLYGQDAGAAYLRDADHVVASAMTHPAVRAWACDESGLTVGLLLTVTRRGVGYLSLLHVLEGNARQEVAAALVKAAVTDLRGRGVRAICGEFVAFRPMALDRTFAGLGFTRVDRQLMIGPLDALPLHPPAPIAGQTNRALDLSAAAAVLVDAYVDHPSRRLHPEAHSQADAEAFFAAVRDGAFGVTKPEFTRVAMHGGRCVACCTAVEAAPGTGFVLHVAVRRDAQGLGMGTQLLREMAGVFRKCSHTKIGLGVTASSPAVRLYERLGLKTVIGVESYVWWDTD